MLSHLPPAFTFIVQVVDMGAVAVLLEKYPEEDMPIDQTKAYGRMMRRAAKQVAKLEHFIKREVPHLRANLTQAVSIETLQALKRRAEAEKEAIKRRAEQERRVQESDAGRYAIHRAIQYAVARRRRGGPP